MTEQTPTAEKDVINAAFPDRSAGRWCGRCEQNGTHHTDRHVEVFRAARARVTPPGSGDAR